MNDPFRLRLYQHKRKRKLITPSPKQPGRANVQHGGARGSDDPPPHLRAMPEEDGEEVSVVLVVIENDEKPR